MNITRILIGGALALSIAGCMSVEGMKAKLNSGDPKQVAEAEETIISNAGMIPGPSKDVMIGCIELLSDDALMQIIDRGYGIYLNDAAKAIKIKNEQVAQKIIEKAYATYSSKEMARSYNEEKNAKYKWNAYSKALPGAISKVANATWLYQFYEKAQPGKGGPGLENYYLEMIANRLCDISCDEGMLVKIIKDSQASRAQKVKAIAKIRGIKYKLMLLDCREFSSMINLNENQIADYLIKVERTQYNMETLRNLLARINDQQLLEKVAVKGLWQNAAEKITDNSVKLDTIRKLVPIWIAKKENDGYESAISRMMVMLATEQDGLLELVKHLGEGNGFYGYKQVIERIADPKIADTMYETMPLRWNDESLDIIKSLISKMSAEKKKKIAQAALERSSRIKDCIVFEAFWIGMPIADFFILSEHFGITANATENKAGKTGVWYKDYLVKEMFFPSKSCQKLLNCEDADILYQVIHKYVMHKSGKASSLDYLKLINYEVEHTARETFNLMSGFSTKHDFKNWATYSNSKLGTKIWFSEKNGVLRFTAL